MALQRSDRYVEEEDESHASGNVHCCRCDWPFRPSRMQARSMEVGSGMQMIGGSYYYSDWALEDQQRQTIIVVVTGVWGSGWCSRG